MDRTDLRLKWGPPNKGAVGRRHVTLLAVVVLAVGCFGCRDKQASIHPVVVAAPAPEPGERPSFYDSNNFAEYYGRCPKCQHWLKGYFGNLLYGDASGKTIGCEAVVFGKCAYCTIDLYADKSGSLTNESRIVTWRAPVNVAEKKTPWLDSGSLVVTNVSPLFFK